MKLLFLRDDSGIKEFSFTKRTIILVTVVCLALLLGTSYLVLDQVTNTIYQAKLKNVKQNNQRLNSLLHNLNSRLDTLENHLGYLQTKDEAIRTYADLPEIDQAIKNLGIGGTRYDKTMELDYLLPSDDSKVSSLLFDIDRVARMIRLERLSYEKLYSAFQHNTAKIESTPSIIPVNDGYFTDGFGWRRDPFNGQKRFHYGLDIASRRGVPVYAAAGGTVRYAKRRGGFGLVVAINHGYGYETLYGHMSAMDVKAGQKVERGTKIGEVGNTGRSTAPHLHYEVHIDNMPMNPIDYFFSEYLE